MFEWYGRATRCYTLLADILWKSNDGEEVKLLPSVSSFSSGFPTVRPGGQLDQSRVAAHATRGQSPSPKSEDQLAQEKVDISPSRWFSRGWTLQELIAPKEVHFYDRVWNQLGARSLRSKEIAGRTGIARGLLDRGYLRDFYPASEVVELGQELPRIRSLSLYSVAQRMSWAADRNTTRIEDRAYSLLGIFGVTMPLLYGEGQRSFTRLQEEILRTNPQPDLSLLLWEKHDGPGDDTSRIKSLFATTPDAFRTCGAIHFHRTAQMMENSVDMAISSVGMKAKVFVMPLHVSDHEDADYAAILNCYDDNDITSTIALKLVSQNNSALANSILDQEPLREQTLSATPYAEYEITTHGAQTRTIRIDIMDAQQRSVFKPVFMAREKPTALDEENKKPLKDMRLSHQYYIWLRFNSFRRLEPKWSVIRAWPQEAWDLAALTFKDFGSHGNIINGDTTMHVGAIAFQRADPMLSRIVLSVTSRLLVRVDLIEHGEINDKVLMSSCRELAQESGAAVRPSYILRKGKSGAGARHRPITLTTKSVHLYDGTRVYEGACFIVKPEIRTFLGRRLRILQLGYSPSLEQFEADFDSRYSRAILSGDEEG